MVVESAATSNSTHTKKIIQELQKPPREPQGYQTYRTSGRETIANQ